jgi:hypothetical protein
MATLSLPVVSQSQTAELRLSKVATFAGLRALAWHDDVLYASRGYALLRARINADARAIRWEHVGEARPPRWRELTSSWRLSARLCRDGFHALAILRPGELIGAVPKAVVTVAPGEREFRTTHRVSRGTRALHITATPNDRIFWGEYFDNLGRDEVHIYASSDRGAHWDVAYTYPKGAIRHVHNIVFDEWENCLWVLTGDNGSECRIMRASCDFSNVEVVLAGKQQARCVALIPTREAIYFASDTPLEQNYVYRLDRRGNLTEVAKLSSSSLCGCRVGNSIFFSTMVEPSVANPERNVRIYGSSDGVQFTSLLKWEKDRWPMGLFQYGNAFFPDGNNTSGVLAVTTVAVREADLETTLWRVLSG